MLGNTDHTLDSSFSSARRSLGAAPVTPGIRHSGKSRRKLPPLSSQIIEELHLAYIGTRLEVSANLDRISTRAEIPKWFLKYEARKRGWRCVTSSRPWLPQEVRHLKEKLGCDYRSSSGAGASGGSGSGADMGTAANMGGKHVTVNVYGHIYGTSGVAEFAGLLNDAVLNGDVPLTATNTKTGVQVIR